MDRMSNKKSENVFLAQNEESKENTKPKFSADQILEKAKGLIDSFEFEAALKFCHKAMSIEPDNIKAIELAGFLYLQLQNPIDAQDCYLKAVEICPDHGHEKYMSLGQLSCGKDAISHYRKGIDIIKRELSQPSGGEKRVKNVDLSNAYLSVSELYMTDLCYDDTAAELVKENLDHALAADASNAEVYHLYASHCINMENFEAAKEYINKGVGMWLPKLKEVQSSEAADSKDYACPITYSGRLNCSKLLIELEEYETASEILEYLLDEDDEVVEVWYLLGWLNYLRGPGFKGNAKGYMEKGIEVALKVRFDDEDKVAHMKEIVQELSDGGVARHVDINKFHDVLIDAFNFIKSWRRYGNRRTGEQ